MRVLVMGAGGVGGHYGGVLACDGHAVTFVARGAHLDAMQAHGLELRTGDQRRVLHPVEAVGKPPADDAFDLVLFTVKTYDTAGAIHALASAVGPNTSVLTLQNGVDSTQHLAAAFGSHRILVGTTVMTSVLSAPGVIETAALRSVVLAELDGPTSDRVRDIAAAFRAVGVDVTVADDARQVIWEKFVLLAALATITSACELPVGPIRESEAGGALLRSLMTEVASVGRACGVALREDVVDLAWQKIAAAPSWARSSMQLDYAARRRVELEELTGTAVRLGQQQGVTMPRLEALYAVLKLRAQAFGGLYSPKGEATP